MEGVQWCDTLVSCLSLYQWEFQLLHQWKSSSEDSGSGLKPDSKSWAENQRLGWIFFLNSPPVLLACESAGKQRLPDYSPLKNYVKVALYICFIMLINYYQNPRSFRLFFLRGNLIIPLLMYSILRIIQSGRATHDHIGLTSVAIMNIILRVVVADLIIID